tara:strand:+ start:348 stop:743 length:396 start_codon:yes stop_codon:yes gene_type:complete
MTQNIEIPTSIGELIDKITILEIKTENITDKAKLKNVQNELQALQTIQKNQIPQSTELTTLTDALKKVNLALWDIEDKIRECEQNNAFDTTFIELARSVYITNDKRAQLKKDINLHTGSTYVEEKSYENYN